MTLVKPLENFKEALYTFQGPCRYLGNEFGSIKKEHKEDDTLFNFAVAFPDKYEIAMSNLAVKIIYNGLNQIETVRAERVFAPDTDFESFLREKKIPLWTLETGMPLYEVDMIGFSIGYELGITEVLAMLELGNIPLTSSERTESHPIIIAGGCGVTNPAPISDFFDAIMIGEAEGGLIELVQELSILKQQNKSRKELLSHIETKSFMWTKNKQNRNEISRRAVQNNFGLIPSIPDWFPQPTIKPVQDHGVIEIMRGCPNGCRFCHAGVYYRPTRVKALGLIIDEIDHLVFEGGYREISLNSLSSADFPDVSSLLDILNDRYKGYNVSFQLPSLKVNSLSLDILEKLNTVRKSGLTFAVETPEEMWQLSLNKEVYAQHLEEIILEAKKRGWSSAKFYFMIGLPFGSENSESEISEEKSIVDFMLQIQAKTKIQCNVNVGVFIPKPHTPYQWVKQISIEEAEKKIDYIYKNLPKGKFKLNRHNWTATVIEGLYSRGDERAGKVILNAYKKGARFDAWDEYLRENKILWEQAFEEEKSKGYDAKKWIYRNWSLDEKLPWDNISLGNSKNYYINEWNKSLKHELTPKCEENCSHKCGICNQKENVHVYTKEEIEKVSSCIKNKTIKTPEVHPESNIPVMYRVIFYFTRKDGGEFIPYLSQIELFHKAFLRCHDLSVIFTQGFNPIPRLEFASAMTLGLPSKQEVASCYLYDNTDSKTFIDSLNKALPSDLQITEAFIFPVSNMRKREPLSQRVWGGVFEYKFKTKEIENLIINNTDFNEYISNDKIKWEKKENYTYILTCPVSDKSLRMLIEKITEKKWFECVYVTKIKMLAKMEISGWTAKDEENWRYNNKNFEKEKITTENKSPVEFIELFKEIAVINEELIKSRKNMDEKSSEFYKTHPEVAELHGKKKFD